MTEKTSKWIKPYMGPFFKWEIEVLYNELSKKTIILDCSIRKRNPKDWCVCTAACGAGLGHNDRYDLFVKISKEHNVAENSKT